MMNLRILLAEHNRYRARLMSGEISEKLPSSITTVAHTVRAAWHELQDRQFDLAIIGLDPNDKNELSHIKQIRRARPRLPLIVVGDNDPELAARATAFAGADGYVTRDDGFPGNLPDLIERLCRHYGQAAHAAGEPRPKQDPKADLIRITAGTLYHEINNPLMTILGMTELILSQSRLHDPEVLRKVRVVRLSAQRIQSILAGLSEITDPAIRETPSGRMIDTRASGGRGVPAERRVPPED